MLVNISRASEKKLQVYKKYSRLKARLNRIAIFTSVNGIERAYNASFITKMKQKGVFYIKEGKYILLLYFFGLGQEVEGLYVIDVIEDDSTEAKRLAKGGLYKIVNLPKDAIIY